VSRGQAQAHSLCRKGEVECTCSSPSVLFGGAPGGAPPQSAHCGRSQQGACPWHQCWVDLIAMRCEGALFLLLLLLWRPGQEQQEHLHQQQQQQQKQKQQQQLHAHSGPLGCVHPPFHALAAGPAHSFSPCGHNSSLVCRPPPSPWPQPWLHIPTSGPALNYHPTGRRPSAPGSSSSAMLCLPLRRRRAAWSCRRCPLPLPWPFGSSSGGSGAQWPCCAHPLCV